MRRPEKP
jgi:magnesium-transporting ATPase (P-type)